MKYLVKVVILVGLVFSCDHNDSKDSETPQSGPEITISEWEPKKPDPIDDDSLANALACQIKSAGYPQAGATAEDIFVAFVKIAQDCKLNPSQIRKYLEPTP